MHLQRIVLPSGRITWTACDGDAVVAEIRDFVIYPEAWHYAPRTISHCARHMVRLGNYLAALDKSFREITTTIIFAAAQREEVSASLPSLWTCARRLSS